MKNRKELHRQLHKPPSYSLPVYKLTRLLFHFSHNPHPPLSVRKEEDEDHLHYVVPNPIWISQSLTIRQCSAKRLCNSFLHKCRTVNCQCGSSFYVLVYFFLIMRLSFVFVFYGSHCLFEFAGQSLRNFCSYFVGMKFWVNLKCKTWVKVWTKDSCSHPSPPNLNWDFVGLKFNSCAEY